MAYWKTGFATVHGERRKVRKLVAVGGAVRAVRIYGKKHWIDKTARKHGLARQPGHWNNPNSARRVDSSSRTHITHLQRLIHG